VVDEEVRVGPGQWFFLSSISFKCEAAIDGKVRKLETVSVIITANGNSGEVNPTKTKCERPLRKS